MHCTGIRLINNYYSSRQLQWVHVTNKHLSIMLQECMQSMYSSMCMHNTPGAHKACNVITPRACAQLRGKAIDLSVVCRCH